MVGVGDGVGGVSVGLDVAGTSFGDGVGGVSVGLGVAGTSVGDGVGVAVGAAAGDADGDGRLAAGVTETAWLGLAVGALQPATRARIRSATTD